MVCPPPCIHYQEDTNKQADKKHIVKAEHLPEVFSFTGQIFFSSVISCGIITLVPTSQATKGDRYDTTEFLDTKSFSGFTEELYVNEQQR